MSTAFLTRITLVNDPAVVLDTTLTRQTALLTLVGSGVMGPAGTSGALSGNAVGDINMMGFDVLNAGVVSFTGEHNNGSSGPAHTIILAHANKHKLTINQNTVLTISTTGAGVGHYQIRLIQHSSGGHTVSFVGLDPTRWLGSATQPAVNMASYGETILSLFFDGTSIIQSMTKVGAA